MGWNKWYRSIIPRRWDRWDSGLLHTRVEWNRRRGQLTPRISLGLCFCLGVWNEAYRSDMMMAADTTVRYLDRYWSRRWCRPRYLSPALDSAFVAVSRHSHKASPHLLVHTPASLWSHNHFTAFGLPSCWVKVSSSSHSHPSLYSTSLRCNPYQSWYCATPRYMIVLFLALHSTDADRYSLPTGNLPIGADIVRDMKKYIQ